MKKVGLFFGTFNPIHIGHLIIGNYIAQYTELKEVWFVVSPHNPLKEKTSLLQDHHRLRMVDLAIEKSDKLKSSAIEFSLPKPSYTTLTLQALKEKHPDYEFSLIMGEDNMRTFHKWKNYEYILSNYNIYVYPRIGDAAYEKFQLPKGYERVQFCDAPVMNISATQIRKMVKEKKDIRFLVTDEVFQYIDEMNFYK